MGACKACNEIFGVAELKNGLCESCIADGYVMKKVEKEKTVTTEQSNPNLIPCKTCRKEISKTAKQCPHCGEEYNTERDTKEVHKLAKEYANKSGKSRLVSLLLTGIFGVFGLFYASVLSGFILMVIVIFGAYVTLEELQITGTVDPTNIMIMLFIAYILPILWGDHVIVKQKRKLFAEAKLMKS
ncbi:MAG: hypothetical protein COB07_12840 [Sulfurovum sp.]|nr:MAG: hypothetical protein COB07_12840 [Sulfurovum sp.]